MIFTKVSELMDKYGWTDIWHPDKNKWGIGIWHNEFDLLCVKRCKTEDEAERYLSPISSSLLMSAYLAESLLKS